MQVNTEFRNFKYMYMFMQVPFQVQWCPIKLMEVGCQMSVSLNIDEGQFYNFTIQTQNNENKRVFKSCNKYFWLQCNAEPHWPVQPNGVFRSPE